MGVCLPYYTVSCAAPCLKWLFAILSLRMTDFDPMPVPVECVWWTKSQWDWYFGFLLSVSLHQCSVLVFYSYL